MNERRGCGQRQRKELSIVSQAQLEVGAVQLAVLANRVGTVGPLWYRRFEWQLAALDEAYLQPVFGEARRLPLPPIDLPQFAATSITSSN